VSLAISWFFWWRQRRPRLEVSYTLTELGALVAIDTPERPVPPLLTAANPATPVLLLLSVANVGRDDLVAEAFDRGKPIRITFEGSRVWSAMRTTPNDLPLTVGGTAGIDITGATYAEGLPGPVLLAGQVPPRDPSPVAVDDPLDHLTVITEPPRLLAHRRRQQRLGAGPLPIREHSEMTYPASITDDPAQT
jgi:hypothetical protein